MIKNFKLYNKPNTKSRLCALSLTGLIITGCLTSCSSANNPSNTIYGQLPNSNSEVISSSISKIFEPGEHIISTPIGDPTSQVKQYVYHPGYKCLGMGTTAYGEIVASFGGAILLYVNEYPVECYSENGATFTDFGTPINYEKTTIVETGDGTKTFGIGEHIISVPISDPTNANVQYQYYEGYEPLDLAISGYGKIIPIYSGGAILYANTVPVICKPTQVDKNNNYQYLTFGTPAEPEELLKLTK